MADSRGHDGGEREGSVVLQDVAPRLEGTGDTDGEQAGVGLVANRGEVAGVRARRGRDDRGGVCNLTLSVRDVLYWKSSVNRGLGVCLHKVGDDAAGLVE